MTFNQKGIATIAIAIIVGAVIVVGGVVGYIMLKQKITQPPAGEPPTGEQITTPPPTDETADWKTYTNKEYGFEIKYPSVFNNLVAIERASSKSLLMLVATGKKGASKNSKENISLDINVFSANEYSFTENQAGGEYRYDSQHNKCSTYWPLSKTTELNNPIKINNLNYCPIARGGVCGGEIGYFVQSNDNKYVVEILYESEEQLVNDQCSGSQQPSVKLDDILSTFKFIK